MSSSSRRQHDDSEVPTPAPPGPPERPAPPQLPQPTQPEGTVVPTDAENGRYTDRGGELPGVEHAVQLAELQDRWLRALADLDNLRKRCQRDIEQARAAERSSVAGELLPVVDNLELALQHADADPGSIVAGVRAVRDQALSALARLGFERIDDSGVRFDPSRHEACQVVPDAAAEPNTVLAVLRPGYSAPGGLLRPAMVAVSARPADRQEAR